MILAFDPGLTHCAAAVIDGVQRPRVRLARYWHQPPNRKARNKTIDLRDRLDRLMYEFEQIAGSTPGVEHVAVEAFQSFAGERVPGFDTLNVLRWLGRVEGWARAHGWTYTEIGTQDVKRTVAGDRSAEKHHVQSAVELLTGYVLPAQHRKSDKERETVADAIAVGIAGRRVVRREALAG